MSLRRIALLGIGLSLVACKKDPPSDAPRSAESAPPKTKALDPNLAEAVAAASAGVQPGAPAAAASGGPPPNGIFAPGAADKELVRGQPPKLTIGSEGNEPRVALRPAQPKPGTRKNLTVRFSVQNGPNQGSLPVELALALEASKPKGEEGEIDEVPVQAKVSSARIAVTGAPIDLEKKVAKLKGAKIDYLVLPDGGATAFRVDVPKGVDESLGDMIASLSDTLAVVTLPVPDKPVGVGAYWMATSRDAPSGLDLMTYRLVKVERVDPSKVTLKVTTKRYSASESFDLPGLPPDVPRSLVEFQAIAEGTVELEPGQGFPLAVRHESALGATLGSADRPNQRAMLEIRTKAEFTSESMLAGK